MKVWHAYKLATVMVFCLIISYLGPLARPVWAAPDHGTYIVQRGDTLFSIARRYGTNVGTLQRLNGLPNPNQIRVGQVLIVPDTGGGSTPAVIQPRFNVSTSPEAVTTGASTCTYVVQPRDYLYKIARQFGISPYQLARANGLSGTSGLVPGQVLRIPSGQCGASSSPHMLPSSPPRQLQPPALNPSTPASQTEPGPSPVPAPVQAPVQPVEPPVITTQSDHGGRVKILEPTPTPTPPIRPEVYD